MDTSPLDLGRQATIRALQQATEDGSLQPAGSGTGKKKSSKVQLSSKPYGYGILLDGARTGAESNKLGAGVFIADILPKSDAARYRESLKVGRQIIAVNSVNVQNATVKEVRALFSANSNILIEVKGNKKLVGAYRKARQLKAENLKCTLVALENQPIGLLIGEAPNGADGVFVTGKLPGSAAAGNDGIQVGDKLVLLNGGSVVDMNAMALANLMATSRRMALTLVRHQAALIEVEVVRSHPDESFGLRMAASRNHNLIGYVITAIAPTGPASAAGLKVGWHITAINDINLEKMNEKELGTTLALNTKTAVAIKFGLTPNDKLLKQVLADKASLPVVSIVPAQPTDGVRKTTLTRGPNGSFGVVFCGTSGVRSTTKGVFISRIIPGTVAAQNSEVKPGSQVLAINGIKVDANHIYTVSRVLNMVSTQMSLTLGPASPLWDTYRDSGHELLGEVGWLKIVLHRAPTEPSWGIVFGGPSLPAEVKNDQSGIFVCGSQPNTAAARRPMPHGYQVCTINGIDTQTATLSDVGEILSDCNGEQLSISVKKNEGLFDAYSASDPKIVTLSKTGGGYGLFIAGPKDEREAKALGAGVVVSGAKVTGVAATTGAMIVGWQILEINGQDVSQGTTSIVKAVLKNVGDEMSLKLIPNMQLARAYKVKMPEYPWLKSQNMVICELDRGSDGYGLQFVGAKTKEEGMAHGYGVMINNFKPGSVAETHGGIPVGWQIGRLNGADLMNATFEDIRSVLGNLEDPKLTMVLVKNPHLFARYRQREYGQSTPPPQKPQHQQPQHQQQHQQQQQGSQATRAIAPGTVVTTITKGPGGFGLTFGGPANEAEARAAGTPGIFISKLKPGGVAEANGRVKAGWQLTRLNGHDLVSATFADLKLALSAAGDTIEIEQIENMQLLQAYGESDLATVAQAANYSGARPTSSGGFSGAGGGGFGFATGRGAAGMLSSMATPHASVAKKTAFVSLVKEAGKGFGVIFDGPKNEEEGQTYGYGLFVKGVKPGSAGANNEDMEVGWQVMSVNGIDVADATFVEFKTALSGVSTELELELEENSFLRDTYMAIRQGKPPPPKLSEVHVSATGDAIFTTSVTKDANGFGLRFGGANTENDGDELGYGIFIRGTKPGSVAAANPDIRENMQIMTLNGIDLEHAIIPDLKQAVVGAGDTLTFTMKENVPLSEAYADAHPTRRPHRSSVMMKGSKGKGITSQLSVNDNDDDDDDDAADSDSDGGGVAMDRVEAPTRGIPTKAAADAEHGVQTNDAARRLSGSMASGVMAAAMTAVASVAASGVTNDTDDAQIGASVSEGEIEVTLSKDDRGFGLKFGGAKTVNDGEEHGYGVFISGTKDDSVAARHPKIVAGLQIVSMNGNDLTDATFSELKDALRSTTNQLVLRLQPNEELFDEYSELKSVRHQMTSGGSTGDLGSAAAAAAAAPNVPRAVAEEAAPMEAVAIAGAPRALGNLSEAADKLRSVLDDSKGILSTLAESRSGSSSDVPTKEAAALIETLQGAN